MSNFPKFKNPAAAFFGAVVLIILALVLWFALSKYGPVVSQPQPLQESAEPTNPSPEVPLAEAIIPPSFDTVRVSRGGTGVIVGRAVPASRVEIYANQVLIGIADADLNGEWVMIIEEPLASGPAELSLLARLFGQDSLESRNIVALLVPEREVKEKLIEGVVAVLTPRDGIGRSRILQKPGTTPGAENGPYLTIETLDYGAGGEMIIAGQAAPRAQMALYLDNAFLGAAKALDDGLWSFVQPESPVKGAHILRIDQVLDEGSVQLRIEQPFEAGLQMDSGLQEGEVLIEPGNSLWHIARSIYGSGFRYTVIFQENADQIRDPDLIYPGQLVNLPKTSPESGPGR